MNVARPEHTDDRGAIVDAIKVNLLIPGLKRAFATVPAVNGTHIEHERIINLLESDSDNLLIYFFQNVFGYEGVPRLHFYYSDSDRGGVYYPINLTSDMVDLIVADISDQDMMALCRDGAENCCEMWRGIIEGATPEHLAASAKSITGLSAFTHGGNYALQFAIANVLRREVFCGEVKPVLKSY